MQEILPGVYHWTSLHPGIRIEVSSYWLSEERVLIDPLAPQEGMDAFLEPPENILLSNRHHYRDSGRFQERFGCRVWCAEAGLHEFTEGQEVEPFAFGGSLPGGIRALEVGVICPDETAFHLRRQGGLLAVADGVVRQGDGPLGFVPDAYIGEDPGAVKAGLKAAYRALLDQEFDHLLLAHGLPWIGGARKALAEFAGS